MTFRLRDVLAPQLVEKGLRELFADVEMPLSTVLREMERAGIALDTAFLQRMSRTLQQSLGQLQETIYQAAGHPFNVNSTQQLGQVLFQELGLPTSVTGRLKSGGYSTASDVLERLRELTHHPIVEAILEQRELTKLKSTYVDALPLLVNRRTGRVHTSFNQTMTSTGRLSSSDPNLQNIPIRTEVGRQVRKAFVAEPGWVLLSADYSQVELRILAHLSQDPGLLEAFAQGEDIHASTAETLFGVPHEQVTSEQRRVAKTVNFGLMYGMSEYGLAQRLGIEQDVALSFINTYFGRYAAVKRYFEETLRLGRQRGYVATVLGRRRYIPELNALNRNVRSAAEREAINMPIQGTAADIIKIAMVRLYRTLQEKGLRSRMLLQVHDELVLEAPKKELDTVVPLVKATMEGAYTLDAPLVAEVHTGATWGDLK
jgi:DNA polymerase-1